MRRGHGDTGSGPGPAPVQRPRVALETSRRPAGATHLVIDHGSGPSGGFRTTPRRASARSGALVDSYDHRGRDSATPPADSIQYVAVPSNPGEPPTTPAAHATMSSSARRRRGGLVAPHVDGRSLARRPPPQIDALPSLENSLPHTQIVLPHVGDQALPPALGAVEGHLVAQVGGSRAPAKPGEEGRRRGMRHGAVGAPDSSSTDGAAAAATST